MLNTDPFANGIEAFGKAVRQGEFTFRQAVEYGAERIHRYNTVLECFEFLATEQALSTATALDNLLTNGTDLGPLMGVPVAVKDIITVASMPVHNGSLHPTSHHNGPEGSLIKKLKDSGCIIIGKTKTVEFALGATGVNEARGTPRNPWDAETHRIPGGSSSGSAVATAAGMCAFALGTDTGGSIRIPACYNGLFGHKTSMGLWPTDGVFPLSPTLDSIGPICRSADDALLIHQHLFDQKTQASPVIKGLRLARPSPVFFEDLDHEVLHSFELAEEKLRGAGATITELSLPESTERNEIFPIIVGAELIATLGSEEFERAQAKMDSVTSKRAAIGLNVSAEQYLNAVKAHQRLKQVAAQSFKALDAWISPTVPMLPMPLASLTQKEHAERALLSSRNTQLGNLYGLCATTLPAQHLADGALPTGLQLMMPANSDTRLLQISSAIQSLIGEGQLPDLNQFKS